jgi:GntR family phosphonate transport system transcriptional regulator
MSERQVNRDSPVPMWHQIELALTQDIRTGVLLPGAKLPAEADVAARFGVHRHTARRALATLAEKGALRIKRGHGTFVEDTLIEYPISQRTRFTANVQQQNRLASHDLLESSDQAATSPVAEALAVAPGTPVTLLQTLGLADGIPISLASTYFPAARFPGLAALYRDLRSVTAVLERFGVSDYLRQSTRITTALPTEQEASLLRQAKRTPILVVESVDVDTANCPISVSRVRFAGERVQFLVG